MRIFLVLICSFALASLAPGAQEDKKKEKKGGAQAGEVSKPGGKKGGGKPAGAGQPMGTGKPTGVKQHQANVVQPNSGNASGMPTAKGKGKGQHQGAGKPAKAGKPAEVGKPAETGNAATSMSTGEGKGKGKQAKAGNATGPEETTAGGKVKGGGKKNGADKPAEVATTATAGKGAAKGKPFKPQKFNLASNTKPNKATAPAVSFHQGNKIQGSQNWQGSNYTAFRNYKSEWHDKNWWHHHSNNVVFIYGGWYALNAGYWYPAWGYAPNAYYAYDGPIYAYNNLPPDQVIANVQAALQEQGYYHGEVDGLFGPLTRAAVAEYQRDNGLYMTSAIDQPTLRSLGMA